MKIISRSLQAAIIKGLLRLVALLPFCVAQAIGKTIGWCLYWFPIPAKKVVRANLALCFPELSSQQRERLARQTFKETVCTFFELPAFWSWPVPKLQNLMKQVSDEQLLKDALAVKKGVIIAMPHLGAWEAMQCYFPGKYTGLIMYRPPRLKELDGFMRYARERNGCARLVPTTASGVKAMLQCLSEGGAVVILPDQVPGKSGVLAPFFGVPTRTMSLIQRLSYRTGATVVFQYIERLGVGKGFHLHFSPASPLVADEDPVVAAQALNEGIESCVRKSPAQYQWFYKRFKKADKNYY